MPTRLLYNPITKKKLHPLIKFNGGRGAILCRKCRKVIKENINIHDIKITVENIFCLECATEMIIKLFKRSYDEQPERTHQDD